MRGVIGAILAGLGAFLIVAAILLPTWVTSQVVKFPLNESQGAVLRSTNASYFSETTLKPVTGATLQATYTISGNPAKGSSSTAVWTQDDTVVDLTNHQPVQKVTRTVAFNRRTGQLVNCCGANVNGNAKIVQTGLVGYVFPFNTQKQTYMVFDATTDKPEPYVYSGTTTVLGIPVYKFEDNVAPTLVTTLTVPGSLVGSKDATVKIGEFDELHLIYYIDPETGALLNVNDHEIVTGHISTGGTLVLYDSDLIPTAASLKVIVGLDSSGRSELALLTSTLPLVFGIVGGVALIAGVFLSLTGRKGDGLPELDGAVAGAGRAAATGD